MRRLLARSAAGSSPTATMPSSLWASRRACSGAILSQRPMTRRLLGAALPPRTGSVVDDVGLDAGGVNLDRRNP